MTMKRLGLFLPAAMLAYLGAIALEAQQLTTNQRPAAQATAAYLYSPIFNDVEIANHHFDRTTRVGPIEVSDNGTVLATAEWPDTRHVGIKDLYLSSPPSVVVEEWENINGTVIEQLINSRSGDVQIDTSNNVAFRAKYSGNGCASGGTCGGLFLKSANGVPKLIANEVNTANGTGVYLLIDGKIAAPVGIWTAPIVTTASSDAGGAAEKKHGGALGAIFTHAGAVIGGMIRGPRGTWVTLNGNSAPNSSPKPEGQQAGTRQGQASAHVPAAWKPEPMPAPLNCAAPPAFPLGWTSDLANAAGPIAFVRADGGGFAPSRYVPVGRPPAQGSWGRRTLFSADCRPIGVALFDGSGRGVLGHSTHQSASRLF